MENKECWLCEDPLGENEVQYCDRCNLHMLEEILAVADAKATPE